MKALYLWYLVIYNIKKSSTSSLIDFGKVVSPSKAFLNITTLA